MYERPGNHPPARYLSESTISTQNTTRQNRRLFAFADSVMEIRSTSTSDDPRLSSPTTAENHQRQQFNETQTTSTSSISSESFQAVGIERDTSAPRRESVRLFETEDEVEGEMGNGDERGRVLGVFEVDVSIALNHHRFYRFSIFPTSPSCSFLCPISSHPRVVEFLT
jgi:hypothetical protein